MTTTVKKRGPNKNIRLTKFIYIRFHCSEILNPMPKYRAICQTLIVWWIYELFQHFCGANSKVILFSFTSNAWFSFSRFWIVLSMFYFHSHKCNSQFSVFIFICFVSNRFSFISIYSIFMYTWQSPEIAQKKNHTAQYRGIFVLRLLILWEKAQIKLNSIFCISPFRKNFQAMKFHSKNSIQSVFYCSIFSLLFLRYERASFQNYNWIIDLGW